MSTRPYLAPNPVIANGSMGASITGSPTILSQKSMLSYSFSWTGSTPVGTVSVQVSNDYALNADGTVKTAGTWNTITLNSGGSAVTTIAVSGNTGNGFIDIEQCSAYAIRPVYTRTSGTGTMQCIAVSKVA